MNRTDRLYAIVEELRAVAPRPRSARWLAQRFEVCVRTVERDLGALQESGVPIYAEPGRVGGYVLDRSHTLPPVNVTPSEAVAIAVALRRLDGAPFADAARSALHKLLAVMPAADVDRAGEMARRVHLLRRPQATAPPPVPGVVADALAAGRVLLIGYSDRNGATSTRSVEPMGYVGGVNHWYLLGWCRLRGAVRAFRLDRIVSVEATDEVVVPRAIRPEELDIPPELVTQVTVDAAETPTGRCRGGARVLSRSRPPGPASQEETANVRDDQRHRLVRDRH
ncbi:MAG: type 11 transcriptional regulator [Dactylosporangium sp.]|nr:type 11 transcriptional regulator [Dactylosporangium sp.]